MINTTYRRRKVDYLACGRDEFPLVRGKDRNALSRAKLGKGKTRTSGNSSLLHA
jgi:hypothetical protein